MIKWLSVFIIFSSMTALAKVNTEIDGDIRIGAEYEQRFETTEPYYEGRAKLESKRKAGYKGSMEIRGESDERKVLLYDTYINYKYEDEKKLQFGYDKTVFGREYQLSSKKRKSIRRTAIYQFMEELGFVGRQYQISYFLDEKEAPTNFSLSLAGFEAEGAQLYGHYQWNVGDDRHYAIWAGLQNDLDDEEEAFLIPVLAFSYWQGTKWRSFEAEIFAGEDPVDSEIERLYGTGDRVYWYGARLQWARRLFLKPKVDYEPFVGASHLVQNTSSPTDSKSQIYFGTRFHLKDLVISLDVDLQADRSSLEGSEVSYDDSQFSAELRKYF